MKGIADGGEDGSLAEARAGRREVVVTELQTLAGPTLLNEKPLVTGNKRNPNEPSGSSKRESAPKASSVGSARSTPTMGARKVCIPYSKWTVSSTLPSVWVSLEVSLIFTLAEASRSGFAPGGKELPTPKNRMVGAGTEMVPVDTWVTAELLVKVCDHVPEAK